MREMRILLVLSIFFAAVCFVNAQETSRDNEPNWCYEGNTWGDGRCNHKDFDIDIYNWKIGWLMAHCQLGLIPAEACYEPDDNVITGGSESYPATGATVTGTGGTGGIGGTGGGTNPPIKGGGNPVNCYITGTGQVICL